jgi:hypothetical protein
MSTKSYSRYHKSYLVTFRIADEPGSQRFYVSQNEYQRLGEGEQGALTFQGGRYLGFKKDGAEG